MERGGAGRTRVTVVNEAVAGHTVNQVEVGAMDVSFVPQGVVTAALLLCHPGSRRPCPALACAENRFQASSAVGRIG